MKNEKILLCLFSILALTVAILSTVPVKHANAINTTDSADIYVTIATRTMVDITPSNLTYLGMAPGSVGYNFTSDGNPSNLSSIQVENIGSTNITNIWFNTSFPDDSPYFAGNPAAYDAANFITISKENNDAYYFVNRLDFNESRSLVYISAPSTFTNPHYGRFKNASSEYFWVVDASTNCNESGQEILIGNNAHNSSNTGTIDFSGASGYTTVGLMNAVDSTEWGVGNVTGGALNGYCVAVYHACDRVIWYKWNMDAPGATNICTNVDFYAAYNITPRNSTVADVRIHVPYGIPKGTVSKGTLTVYAESMESA